MEIKLCNQSVLVLGHSEVCKLRELLPEYNIDYLLSEADDSA